MCEHGDFGGPSLMHAAIGIHARPRYGCCCCGTNRAAPTTADFHALTRGAREINPARTHVPRFIRWYGTHAAASPVPSCFCLSFLPLLRPPAHQKRRDLPTHHCHTLTPSRAHACRPPRRQSSKSIIHLLSRKHHHVWRTGPAPVQIRGEWR